MTRTAMRKDADSGSTLVEVMIAVVILLTIALAGGAFLMHSRSQLSTQRSKRIILEAVNARLENIRATGYTAITDGLPQNGSTHFLSLQGTKLVYSASDPGETVSINDFPYAMVTTVQFVDVLGLIAEDKVEVMGGDDIDIHAAILVTDGNSGFTTNQKYKVVRQPYLNVYGALSQKRRGIVGTTSGRGFLKNYKHDPTLGGNPPPCWPLRSYDISRWERTK